MTDSNSAAITINFQGKIDDRLKASAQKNFNKFFNVLSKDNLYKCLFQGCERSFQEKGNLKIHMRIHTGERPYICHFENCGKTFITIGNLKSHICRHTGINPFKCPYEGCNKNYNRLCRFKIHLRTHTGLKPFKCPFDDCSKIFNEKGNMRIHMRTHTGEKPYRCSYAGCFKAFKAQGHLKDHIKRHCAPKKVECKLCEQRFSKKFELKDHFRNDHSKRIKLNTLKMKKPKNEKKQINVEKIQENSTAFKVQQKQGIENKPTNPNKLRIRSHINYFNDENLNTVLKPNGLQDLIINNINENKYFAKHKNQILQIRNCKIKKKHKSKIKINKNIKNKNTTNSENRLYKAQDLASNDSSGQTRLQQGSKINQDCEKKPTDNISNTNNNNNNNNKTKSFNRSQIVINNNYCNIVNLFDPFEEERFRNEINAKILMNLNPIQISSFYNLISSINFQMSVLHYKLVFDNCYNSLLSEFNAC